MPVEVVWSHRDGVAPLSLHSKYGCCETGVVLMCMLCVAGALMVTWLQKSSRRAPRMTAAPTGSP